MKIGIVLMVWGMLAAQNFNESEIYNFNELKSQQPKEKIPFELTWYDIRSRVHMGYVGGRVNVEFTIDENGDVINPVIIDTFNLTLNDVVLDRVKQSKYYPATQNGRPVKVKYTLPIKFK